jgi:hypothetical protein
MTSGPGQTQQTQPLANRSAKDRFWPIPTVCRPRKQSFARARERRTAFARGDFAANGIAAKGSDDLVRVMVAALLEPFSFSTFQRLSCLLGCVLTAPCRNAMQDNWLAAGDQLKAATLAKEFRLALVEVARQRLNNYRLTHLQEA